MGDVTLVRAFINEVGAVDSCAKHLPKQQQQQPLEARDASGRTPLRVAIDHDRPEVARLLLLLPEKEEASRRRQRFAVDVNTRDARGWTPLASACAYARDERTLQLLLDAGADLNWKDPRDGERLTEREWVQSPNSENMIPDREGEWDTDNRTDNIEGAESSRVKAVLQSLFTTRRFLIMRSR